MDTEPHYNFALGKILYTSCFHFIFYCKLVCVHVKAVENLLYMYVKIYCMYLLLKRNKSAHLTVFGLEACCVCLAFVEPLHTITEPKLQLVSMYM